MGKFLNFVEIGGNIKYLT